MKNWLVVLTTLKNISQWEGISHILWKIKNVPNHQPENKPGGYPLVQHDLESSCLDCDSLSSPSWKESEFRWLVYPGCGTSQKTWKVIKLQGILNRFFLDPACGFFSIHQLVFTIVFSLNYSFGRCTYRMCGTNPSHIVGWLYIKSYPII